MSESNSNKRMISVAHEATLNHRDGGFGWCDMFSIDVIRLQVTGYRLILFLSGSQQSLKLSLFEEAIPLWGYAIWCWFAQPDLPTKGRCIAE